MIYSVTTQLSISLLQKFLHSKRELQHTAFDADTEFIAFHIYLHHFHVISGFDL